MAPEMLLAQDEEEEEEEEVAFSMSEFPKRET